MYNRITYLELYDLKVFIYDCNLDIKCAWINTTYIPDSDPDFNYISLR